MTFTKDPDDVLDYEINWAARLADDTIATSTRVDVTTGITVDSNSHTTTTTTVWLSGGTVGTKYKLTNRITTAGGRTFDNTITISVTNR